MVVSPSIIDAMGTSFHHCAATSMPLSFKSLHKGEQSSLKIFFSTAFVANVCLIAAHNAASVPPLRLARVIHFAEMSKSTC
eukprot:4430204-Ditylum_brightwellii.AAC.1